LDAASTQKTVVGSAVVLQAGVTAAAAITGGLPALYLNDEPLAIAGLASLLIAGLLTALITALGSAETEAAPGSTERTAEPVEKRKTSRAHLALTSGQKFRLGLTIAAALIFSLALAITAYAAVRVPGLESEPEVSVSIQNGNPLVLKATVKASGIRRGENLNIYVDGLKEITAANGEGKYENVNPTLYQAHVGASASGGDVSDSFTIPIPVGKYNDLGISAWKGTDTKCSPPSTPSSFKSNKGCVVVRLVNLGTAPSAAKATGK
jgi:hypothetical protein